MIRTFHESQSKISIKLRQARPFFLGSLGVVSFLIVWQLLPTVGIVDARFLPYASETLARLVTELGNPSFYRNVLNTLTGWGLGFLIAVTLATVLGTIIGMVPWLRRATHTTVEFLRPIPSVAFVPLAILIYGMQLKAALLIIVFASFWQIFVQVLYGVADVDTVARDTAKSFGLSPFARIYRLVLPSALPYFMTGLRLAATVALILSVTAEMVIGNPGLGRQIVLSQSAGDWVGVYALVVVAGLLGVIVNVVFRVIERRSLSWHQSIRGEEIL